MQRTILLATFVGFTMCALLWARHTSPIVEEIQPLVLEVGEDSYEYVRADESDADTVFVVDITRPNHALPTSHRFPLKHNPGAPNRGVGGVCNSIRACGPGCCFGLSVHLSGYDDKTNTLSLSVRVDWIDRDDSKGEADGEFAVAWLGEARQAISNGVMVHAYFAPPAK